MKKSEENIDLQDQLDLSEVMKRIEPTQPIQSRKKLKADQSSPSSPSLDQSIKESISTSFSPSTKPSSEYVKPSKTMRSEKETSFDEFTLPKERKQEGQKSISKPSIDISTSTSREEKRKHHLRKDQTEFTSSFPQSFSTTKEIFISSKENQEVHNQPKGKKSEKEEMIEKAEHFGRKEQNSSFFLVLALTAECSSVCDYERCFILILLENSSQTEEYNPDGFSISTRILLQACVIYHISVTYLFRKKPYH